MRIVAIAILLVSSLAITRTAAAQPSLTPPMQPIMPAPLPAPELPDAKSESTATMLSLGTTAAGVGLVAAGIESQNSGTAMLGAIAILVGPSAGHIYAGEAGHALGMSLLRSAAVIAIVAGFIDHTTAAVDCLDCSGQPIADDHRTGDRLMWGGGIALVALTVYDLVDAPRAARRRNEHDRMMVMPTMIGTANGVVPAVGFSGRF